MHSHSQRSQQAGRPGHAGLNEVNTRADTVHTLLVLQARVGNAAVNRVLEDSGDAEGPVADRIKAAAGGGAPLPAQTRGWLERELGSDLSGVRVHHDGKADSLARAVQAQAFTSGSDIFFRAGTYEPSSPGGLHLLAHEAVHTVQQRQGPVGGTPVAGGIQLSDPGDRFERAAEEQAARMVSRLSND